MIPFWLPMSWASRMKTIKEGKNLTQQIQDATQAGVALGETAQAMSKMKPNLLVPGAAVAGTGLLASKVAADKFAPREQQAQNFSYMNQDTANFIGLGILATIENTGANLIHGMRNANMKKKLQSIQNANDVVKSNIEAQRMQQMKHVPTALAGIGLGTAALATPTMMYMNNKYNEEN